MAAGERTPSGHLYDETSDDDGRYSRMESMPHGFLPMSWVPSVVRVPWSRVLEIGGLDAYTYLRYIRMCFRIVCVSGFWSLIILIPVYATGRNNDEFVSEGWYRYSMAHISRGSWRLWFPAFFCWLMTFYVCFVMNEEYKHFTEKRIQFLTRANVDVHPQHNYSIMVEGLPSNLRSDRDLYEFFNRLFPNQVHSACIVLNVQDLKSLTDQRFNVKKRLEKAHAYHVATGRRPVHIHGRDFKVCAGIESMTSYGAAPTWKGESPLDTEREPSIGERVDSINYYQRELRRLDFAVQGMQREKIILAGSLNEVVRSGSSSSFSRGLDLAYKSVSERYDSQEDGMLHNYDDMKGAKGSLSLLGKIGLDFLVSSIKYFYRHTLLMFERVSSNPSTSTGFVTFNNLSAVTLAASAPLLNQGLQDNLEIVLAPEPRDIQWNNVHIDIMWTSGREWIANVLLTFGVILWSVPVTLIQALASTDSLAQLTGWDWLSNIGGEHTAFINGYLPVVSLLGIIMLLPVIFRWIAENYENRKTKSGVESSILVRFFYYQLANIYITVSAGSIWDALYKIVDHPGNAFAILSASFPSVVGYFVSLLMTKTLAGLPIVMLRVTDLGRYLFYKLCFRERKMTQRELDNIYKPAMLQYGYEYPTQLLVIVICFTYACISPVILPFGAAYFLFALVVYKMQVLYVFSSKFESGGAMFPSVCNRTLIGLICGQLTLIGYMLTMHGFTQFIFLFPLPILTFKVMQSFKSTYAHSSLRLSLKSAKDLDEQHHSVVTTFESDCYRQPCMKERTTGPMPYRRMKGDDVVDTSRQLGLGLRGFFGPKGTADVGDSKIV